MQSDVDLLAASGFVISLLLGTVAWLIRAGLAEIRGSLSRVEAKLDIGAEKDAAHDSALVELRLRVGHVEGEQALAASWRSDMTGFLQSLGYRKRDGATVAE